MRFTKRSSRPFLFSGFALLVLAALHAPAEGQLTTRRIATGFSNPLWVGAPEGDPRLFIGLKNGRIRIFENGQLLTGTFINLSSQISTGSEQGLLGVAFHPDYANTGWVFIDYTNTAGNTVVSRFTVDPNDPNLLDPTSEVVVLTISQPFSNHNGGDIHFGPDGYLYIATGDGGSANDPGCRAQDLGSLLGKMLRIDVDSLPYSIPPDNPFVGVPGAKGEIWHYGLRNPWRFSFDRQTGDLYIGDVGQNAREEIDFAPAGVGGLNFGWKVMEANRCNSSFACDPSVPPCFDPAFTPPIQELFQSGFTGPLAIIGGYVYRGDLIPSLQGTYFYADFNDDKIRSVVYDPQTGTTSNFQDRTAELAPGGGLFIRNIASFGEDGFGELYIVEHTSGGNGEIYKILPANAAQASAVVMNGSGVNPVVYTNLSLPILGGVYRAQVDVSGHAGGAAVSVILGFTGTNSILLPFGELLISGTQVVAFAQTSSGGIDVFEEDVPPSLGLNGVQVQTQAFAVGGGITEAYNAILLTAGMY